MDLSAYFENEIRESERRVRSIATSMSVNRAYVSSLDVDPKDVEYFRCQIELEAIEREYLARRLAVLRKWSLLNSGAALGCA